MNFFKFLKFFMLTMILVLLTSYPLFAKPLTKAELMEMGGKTMTGTVTKVGVYNFYLQLKNGEEKNIHTDAGTTQFIPKKERLMIGDEIEFIYFSPESASLSTDKKLAQHIEFIKKVPRQFLTDEMECIISISQRNEKACYLPSYNKTISFEGNWPKRGNYNINTTPGSKVLIQLKAIPAKIGNGYVYILVWVKPFYG